MVTLGNDVVRDQHDRAGRRGAAAPDPAQRKAWQLAKYLRAERPGWSIREVFRHLRVELAPVTTTAKKLPFVPTEAQIRAFDEQVWRSRRGDDIVLITTLLHTG